MGEGINYSEILYQHSGHDIDILEKNAKENPYSSLASFLLLYHYKKINHPDFEKLAKKTALHFNNTHWLQFLLGNTTSRTDQEIISDHNPDVEQTEINEINSTDVETSSMQSFNDTVTAEEMISKENIESGNIQEIQEIKTDSIPETLEDNNLHQETQVLEGEQNFETKNYETEQVKETETKESNAEEVIAFEPLHTVDYFASQGIKITDEPITTDKLGNQMKSFTQWLKSMKKLHPGKLEEQPVVNEKLIQSAAEESNINTEILTEAMAEVLIKQDKKEKAIEMFNKLSLINPSKSAYFAAKIESIKSS